MYKPSKRNCFSFYARSAQAPAAIDVSRNAPLPNLGYEFKRYSPPPSLPFLRHRIFVFFFKARNSQHTALDSDQFRDDQRDECDEHDGDNFCSLGKQSYRAAQRHHHRRAAAQENIWRMEKVKWISCRDTFRLIGAHVPHTICAKNGKKEREKT